jgi:hypothetical protein
LDNVTNFCYAHLRGLSLPILSVLCWMEYDMKLSLLASNISHFTNLVLESLNHMLLDHSGHATNVYGVRVGLSIL